MSHTGNKPSAVGHGQLQSGRCRPLKVPGGIVRVPDQHARHGAVHAHGHEARHAEAHAGGLDVRNGGVAGDGNGQHGEHGGAAEFDAVRDEGDEDWRDAGVSNARGYVV